jgi:hypothetical protein
MLISISFFSMRKFLHFGLGVQMMDVIVISFPIRCHFASI